MELGDTFCDMCGGNNWKPVKGGWKRCQTCHFLDTTAPDRMCQICGRPVGHLAKASLTLCANCKTVAEYPVKGHCETPFCGRKIKRHSGCSICDECLYELNHWNTPNGPRWKEAAVKLLKSPVQTKDIHAHLKVKFPELSRDKLSNWISRQYRSNLLVRVDHGTYQQRNPNK